MDIANRDTETMDTSIANTKPRGFEVGNEIEGNVWGEVEDREQQNEGRGRNTAAGVKQEKEDEEAETDPSEILKQLERSLDSIEDNGTFATSNSYHSTPNPVISIEGIGIVGLPLSIRDAEAIVGVATQAPLGHGERAIIDKNVRDTWELRPDQVQFLNPLWESFIDEEVLPTVADELGIHDAARTVWYELYKVQLYKERRRFPPHKDTGGAPGVFCTLMIVLPSLYTGGVVQLSYAGSQKNFDFGGPTSHTTTSYAAWYSNILHSVSPVTSGYRFSLIYNIIDTNPAATPQLPAIEAQIVNLRSVLRTWARRADDPGSPRLVGWMLSHRYPEQALNEQRIAALKGADKVRGKILLDLAEELEFEFYLAQMVYRKTGTVEFNGYGSPFLEPDSLDSNPNDSDSDSDKVMDEVIDKNLTAHNFVNAKVGVALPAHFRPSFERDECLPVGYWNEVEDPDSKYFESFSDDRDATLDYWYYRTAIIIWPSRAHARVISDLCHDWDRTIFLDRALWTQAQVEQGKRLKFGESIISQLAMSPPPMPVYRKNSPSHLPSKELMEFALEEKRLDLFLKMVEITKSTNLEKVTQVAAVFGLDGTRDFVQRGISNTKGIENQLRIAVKLYQQQPEELKIIVERLAGAVSISEEVKPEKLQGLLDLVGQELFQSCIIPNLEKDFSNTYFWVECWKQYPDIDWIQKTLPNVVYAHKPRIRLTRDGNRYTISSQTLPLFIKSVEMLRADLAREVIHKIQAIPIPEDATYKKMKWKYLQALIDIIKKVIKVLKQHNIPITTEQYAYFIRKTYVDKILPTLGPRPCPDEDFRLPTMRVTGQVDCCPNCDLVDNFLADRCQQTVSYHHTYSWLQHLIVKLQKRPHLSMRNDPIPSKNVVSGILTLTKVGISAVDVVKRWDKRRAQIEGAFIAIGDEKTRRGVFGQLFPIIEMAIRDRGMGWGKEMKEAAVMGEREEQQRREQLQNQARTIVNAMDAHARTAPPGENWATPPTSLRAAGGNTGGSGDLQVTSVGRKRKRPLKVIDLTDE